MIVAHVNSTCSTCLPTLENTTYGNRGNGISKSEYTYVALTGVTSGLSMIGGICICALYFMFKDMRTPSRKLLLFLAISDGLLALGNLLGILWYLYSDSVTLHRSKGYCAFQSAMTIYFSITSFFWTVTMAISLFMVVVLNNVSFTATYMKLFHLLAWIPPGIIVVVALGLDILGTDTTLDQASWCWIDPRVPNALIWQLVTGKVWEILAYVTTVVLYSIIKVVLRKQAVKKMSMVRKNVSRSGVLTDASRKLTFVPLVFIVCRIWGTLRFLLGNFANEYINEPYVTWINPLQGIGDSAQGFANFVLYCFSTARIRRRILRCLWPSAYKADPRTKAAGDSHSKAFKRSTVGVEETTIVDTPCSSRQRKTAPILGEVDINHTKKDSVLSVRKDSNVRSIRESGSDTVDEDGATITETRTE